MATSAWADLVLQSGQNPNRKEWQQIQVGKPLLQGIWQCQERARHCPEEWQGGKEAPFLPSDKALSSMKVYLLSGCYTSKLCRIYHRPHPDSEVL